MICRWPHFELFLLAAFFTSPVLSQDSKTSPKSLVEPPRKDIAIPAGDLSIPAWVDSVDKSGDAPFPVRKYLESRSKTPSDAERLYLLGLAEVSLEMREIFPKAERVEWESRVKPLEEEINALQEMDDPPLDRLRSILKRTTRARELLEAAQKQPSVSFTTKLTLMQLLPHCHAARIVARLAALELRHSHDSGTFPEAERTIFRTLRLARDIRNDDFVVSQLVSIALDAILLDAVRKCVLNRSDLTPADCDRLIGLLRQHEAPETEILKRVLRAEYVVCVNTFDGLRTGTLKPTELDESFTPATMRAFRYETEMKQLNESFQVLQKYYDTPHHLALANNTFHSHMKELKTKVLQAASNPVTLLLNGARGVMVVYLMPALEGIPEALARNAARLRGYQAVIALQRFVLVNRKWPESLEAALEAANLPRTLVDPYSGQSLRYVIRSGRPLVYSVGSDQKDDLGRADWKFGEQPGDFLFPVPDHGGPE